MGSNIYFDGLLVIVQVVGICDKIFPEVRPDAPNISEEPVVRIWFLGAEVKAVSSQSAINTFA